MSIKSFVIAQGILALLKDANRKGLVIDLASKIDEISDKDLGSKSEKVQSRVVEVVLLPLSKTLLRENPAEFERLLKEHLGEVVNGPRVETPKAPKPTSHGNGGNFGSRPKQGR